jgi:hypothetical protein
MITVMFHNKACVGVSTFDTSLETAEQAVCFWDSDVAKLIHWSRKSGMNERADLAGTGQRPPLPGVTQNARQLIAGTGLTDTKN